MNSNFVTGFPSEIQTEIRTEIQTEIQTRLCAACPKALIEVVGSTGSSNADLMARRFEADSIVRVALHQTAGRGRANRPWHGEVGASIMFSVGRIIRRKNLQGVSLAVGLALHQALAAEGLSSALKWPNDVLVFNKNAWLKLAGILLQSVAHADADADVYWLVAGVGLNYAKQTAPELAQTASSFLQAGGTTEFAALVPKLARAVLNALESFEQTGFAPMAAAWNAAHAYKNQPVHILDQGKILHQGIALGVDDEGVLILDCKEGLKHILAGDVSLRGAL
jgi:BirA family biotin operon repressor/biotin-[acetyl-CoA-carboxylase] ligase